MIVRAVERQDQGFLFDSGEAIAWKCAFIDMGCSWETLCSEQQTDYDIMLEGVRASSQLLLRRTA